MEQLDLDLHCLLMLVFEDGRSGIKKYTFFSFVCVSSIIQGGGWVWQRCLVSYLYLTCILRHRGVQLILAYNWARPAILVAGKGRGEMFLFLLFLHFHSCSSFSPVPLFHLLYYLFCPFSPFLWETTPNDPQGLTCC